MKNDTIKTEDEKDKKDAERSSEDSSSRCKMCNGRHDLDECKAFNDMTVDEKSIFLSKQKLWYGCYEAISPKHTARNCPRRETVRSVWQSIQLVYMDTRSEGKMTVKVMMIQKRLSKRIVPTSKMFSVTQLELEKFLACV